MYIPTHFVEHDDERIARLIADNSFGLLLTVNGAKPCGSHLPFLRERGRLYCHLARANPQVEHLRADREVLVVFTGPHAYVSPSWYETPGVPTWNYTAVHIYGHARPIEDRAGLAALVERLARRHEQYEARPWEPDYDTSMLNAIIGFEITPTEIQAKFKLSQNRPRADRLNVIERLRSRASDDSVGTAELMKALDGQR